MIALRQMLKSGFVDFAAMGDYVNGELVLRRIDGIEDAPMNHAQFVQICESARQCFGLDLIEMLDKPLNFLDDSFCNRGIQLGKVFKRLRGEQDVMVQTSLSLSFTSWSGMRSDDFSDDSILAWISSVSSRY
jgi:hypothetical protein